MAREHARLWLDINSDDDFEALPFDAQGFYCRVILTLDDLSYCGVADWRPRKLTTKAPDLTYTRILTAAQALEQGRLCLFDLDTEEVLARSFIRRDELLRNPKMAAAVVKAFNGIASKTLRAAVVTEIRRVHQEHPDYSSWSHKDVGPALSKIMGKPGLDEVGYTDQIKAPNTNGQAVDIGNPNPVQNGDAQMVPNTETDRGSEYQFDSVPIPSTYTSTSTPAPLEGLRNRGTSPGPATPDRNNPQPPRCVVHINDPNPPPCGQCAEVRKADEALQRGLREAAEARRRLLLDEIDACTECDEHGWKLATDGTPVEPASRCPNHDWSIVHAYA